MKTKYKYIVLSLTTFGLLSACNNSKEGPVGRYVPLNEYSILDTKTGRAYYYDLQTKETFYFIDVTNAKPDH